jgi:type IV pilus assembly protein PilE
MITAASYRRRAGGFTLIELMVTVAIATVLASIALPSYMSSVRKSRRTEARTALLNLASMTERMYSTTNSYLNGAALLPTDVGYTGTAWPITVGSGYYTVSATVTATTFTFTATPTAGTSQVSDTQCATFSVDQTGRQTAADSGANNTTDTCWN